MKVVSFYLYPASVKSNASDMKDVTVSCSKQEEVT